MNLSIPFIQRSVEALETQTKAQSKGKPVFLPLSVLLPRLLVLALLTSMILSSALAVVYSAYDYRRLFHQHQLLVRQSDQIRIEWGQLLIEQSAWGTNNRVEVQAMERLDMKLPESDSVRLIRDGAVHE